MTRELEADPAVYGAMRAAVAYELFPDGMGTTEIHAIVAQRVAEAAVAEAIAPYIEAISAFLAADAHYLRTASRERPPSLVMAEARRNRAAAVAALAALESGQVKKMEKR